MSDILIRSKLLIHQPDNSRYADKDKERFYPEKFTIWDEDHNIGSFVTGFYIQVEEWQRPDKTSFLKLITEYDIYNVTQNIGHAEMFGERDIPNDTVIEVHFNFVRGDGSIAASGFGVGRTFCTNDGKGARHMEQPLTFNPPLEVHYDDVESFTLIVRAIGEPLAPC